MSNLETLLTIVAVVGYLIAWVRAATDFAFLGSWAPRARQVADLVAANVGCARNAAEILAVYRTQGPVAAIAELDRLVNQPARSV